MSRAREFADLAGSADAGGLTGRNLIISGAMQVAQRGATATTSAGFQNVDRFQSNSSQATITRSQETLSSGGPYDSGFRKFYRLQVTSASSATNAYAEIHQPMEGQNIVHSGWNYASTSSKITISFWARSSLAGTYYIMYRMVGSSERRRNGAFTLAADTWTKVTFTTAGNSGLTINNDNTREFDVFIVPHYGTSFTGGEEVSTTDWYDRNSQGDAYLPNFAQNWTNTANATFDVTGVQLEVGDVATPFEHRSYGDELARCARYFYRFTGHGTLFYADYYSTDTFITKEALPVEMRVNPTVTSRGTGGSGGSAFSYTNLAANPTLGASGRTGVAVFRGVASSARTYVHIYNTSSDYSVDASAEL